MARSEQILTAAWAKVGDGPGALTVKSGLGKRLAVNDHDADDSTAYQTVATDDTQIVQTEAKEIWAKGDGITLLVDLGG